MAVILGIDAAWTARQPSGVALVDLNRRVKCVTVASSYHSFIAQSEGQPIRWWDRQPGGEPDIAGLLRAAERLCGRPVDVIAVDMPLATVPITARRAADDAISREYGSRWCSAHSPSAIRPGPLSDRLAAACSELGFPLATATTAPGTLPCLLEVYPHPALLTLVDSPRRVPYKVAKVRKYWPDSAADERRSRVFDELRSIESKLAEVFGPLPIVSSGHSASPPTGVLKRYEDMLDALVSAWVGTLYVRGLARPYGDERAAVWCPVPEFAAAVTSCSRGH